MGHIWLIYGLYMGYLTEYTMVKTLQGLYKILVLYKTDNEPHEF
ncbi:hypothetical protein SAMN04488121_101197 [Chitinophaga filiformis]|uniref:Uncharacterized protein n=1 Tax=Chitinophaga filiformis TaxID=104663 RepID=A0A1G7GX04_CHIFI|nr:hypothetical protein SAMN04488121_101197 [Chitinophaga filiformis]